MASIAVMSIVVFQFVPEGIASGCRVWPSDWPEQQSITAGAGLVFKPLFLLTVIGRRTQAEVKLYPKQLLHIWLNLKKKKWNFTHTGHLPRTSLPATSWKSWLRGDKRVGMSPDCPSSSKWRRSVHRGDQTGRLHSEFHCSCWDIGTNTDRVTQLDDLAEEEPPADSGHL